VGRAGQNREAGRQECHTDRVAGQSRQEVQGRQSKQAGQIKLTNRQAGSTFSEGRQGTADKAGKDRACRQAEERKEGVMQCRAGSRA
jgi:hypothetical protein